MQFTDLQLDERLLAAVRRLGYRSPTAIQTRAIPLVLQGRDVLACAQTGTGKTAAFALPILQRLLMGGARRGPEPRALILAPTRELVAQIADSFTAYAAGTGLRALAVYGGVNQRTQVSALRAGVDVLVAAPGRLLDLLGQRLVSLRRIEVLVLDESDRMLDMGFIAPIRELVGLLPAPRQTLMFSATMPAEIRRLASQMLSSPVEVAVAPVASTIEGVAQDVYFVAQRAKVDLLKLVLATPEARRVIVFTRTKRGADKVGDNLRRARIAAEVIHGNKSQNARQRALESFRGGRSRVLVATDVAARGIDVEGISHVVNFDVPREPEGYVHRIGRTGRAGAVGAALSFCDRDERSHLKDIERLIKRTLRVVREHPFSPHGQAA